MANIYIWQELCAWSKTLRHITLARYTSCVCFGFAHPLYIPFTVLALFFLLSPCLHRRNSDPGSLSRLFPPSPLRYAPSFLSWENSSYFFPRRLASNCVVLYDQSTSLPWVKWLHRSRIPHGTLCDRSKAYGKDSSRCHWHGNRRTRYESLGWIANIIELKNDTAGTKIRGRVVNLRLFFPIRPRIKKEKRKRKKEKKAKLCNIGQKACGEYVLWFGDWSKSLWHDSTGTLYILYH